MDFLDKLKFDSLAKKKDVKGLMDSFMTRGRNDQKCKEYILRVLETNFSLSDVEDTRYTGVKLSDREWGDIFLRMGDEGTLRKMITYPDGYGLDQIMAMYERFKNDALRTWIISSTQETIQKGLEEVGLIMKSGQIPKVDPYATRARYVLIEKLGGWDKEFADMLIKRIDFYEEDISRILKDLGASVVEKLIPWLDNKKEGYIQKTWHQGAYDSLDDSHGEGWYSAEGDQYPIQNRVRKVLFEITGQRFTTSASAHKWLEIQKVS